MDIEGSFGHWVKDRRQALGLTQRGLAHQLGCSLSVIQKIEIDERRPSREIAELLAHHLELAPEEHDAFVHLARARLHEPLPLPSISQSAERFDNLPAPLTSLVGREWEVETLRALLARDDVRLLTISGPPGIGKTRLALQTARKLLGAFENGACFVALAPIADASYVVPTIARTLGVGGVERVPLIKRLISYLRGKHLLLVLDSFEHVLSGAAQVAELLENAPQLKVLISSRALLQLYGEHEFVAPPLALPDIKHLPGVGALARYAAIELFVQRACAAKLDFVLSEQNAASVAELCVRLDGLPLAIELAAARSKQLPPEALLARLTSPRGDSSARLEVLTSGVRNLPPRQQTLYAAIEWSYTLLTPVEQRVFRTLGVFAGGCNPAAIRAVNGLPNEATASWLVDVVHSLVDKSLVIAQPGQDDEPRFALLEMIREYALQQMATNGEVNRVRQLHANFFLRMGEIIDGQGVAPGSKAWLAFEFEYDNLLTALRWALESDAASGLLLAAALGDFWNDRGLLTETRQWLPQVLAQVQPELSRRYAHATRRLAVCLWQQGDYVAAQEWLEKCVMCWRRLDDSRELGIALHFLALVLYNRDEYAAAIAPAQEAVVLLRGCQDSDWLAIALNALGTVNNALANHATASMVLEESLALCLAQDNDWGVALAMLAMADIPYVACNYDAARGLLEKALQIYRRLEERWLSAQTLWYLGKVCWHQRQIDLSIVCWVESVAIGREIGAKEYVAGSLLHMGFAALRVKDINSAHAHFGESLAIYRQMEHNAGIGYALSGLAGVMALCNGSMKRSLIVAAQVLGAATALLASRRKLLDDLEYSEYKHIIVSVCTQLGEEEFLAANDKKVDLDVLLHGLANILPTDFSI